MVPELHLGAQSGVYLDAKEVKAVGPWERGAHVSIAFLQTSYK